MPAGVLLMVTRTLAGGSDDGEVIVPGGRDKSVWSFVFHNSPHDQNIENTAEQIALVPEVLSFASGCDLLEIPF